MSYQEGGPARVQQTKARSGRCVDPFQVSIEDTANGGVLLVATDLASEPSAIRKLTGIQAAILELFAQEPEQRSARSIATKLDLRRNDVADALELMIEAGRIVSTGSTSNRRLRLV
jgi:DNA-binding MarR family transcriptional regulator